MPPFLQAVASTLQTLLHNTLLALKRGIASVVKWATEPEAPPKSNIRGQLYFFGDAWAVDLTDGTHWHSKRKRDLTRRARERGIDLVELVEDQAQAEPLGAH